MLKVLVPDVPSLDKIIPYLRAIDENKWYTNNGPLVMELERRLGGVTVSSATAGLEIVAPLVFRREVRIPAFTFVATATALVRAGLRPVICDVDESWALKDIDGDSLPVCPFGSPVKPGGLVDAASAWGNQQEGVRVYSLHATKSLPAGEGGLVVGPPELMARVRRLANFGLETTAFAHGIVAEAGTNAKLSEYHAAVCLAALDWFEHSKRWRLALDLAYTEMLPDFERQPRPPGIYTTFPVVVDDAERVARRMAERGIETRRWYCPTIERHPAFSGLPVEGDLRNAKRLNDGVLCLPFHKEVMRQEAERVCETLRWAITGKSARRLFIV
jgi:dTDP-4-amino-4,6-dideoxygalactose transaminase